MAEHDLSELRVQCRLAWNGWEDTSESRRIIAEHEAKDSYSAAAWDRVIDRVIASVDDANAALSALGEQHDKKGAE